MQDLRDLYKAYSAVHDTTIQEELDNSKDQITKMNLSKMRDEDLVEVAEEIIEGLFQYGKTLDEAYDVVGSILEQASDNIIGDRKNKILRIAEAFEKAFDTVTNKAERKCEEDFLKYRKAKPLNEKWYNKFSHEVGNTKVHASIIHEDRECVKNGLIEMISEKLDKVGQEDDDIDNDGDVDSSDKYLAKRRKAIGKAMKKEETQVAELYKGKHGQSEKEYAASRSQGGKMISGDDKRSGAEYTHGRRVKAENPGMQPDVGGKTKPKSQGKMDSGSREDLKYRKAKMFSKEELEAIQAKVDSWE